MPITLFIGTKVEVNLCAIGIGTLVTTHALFTADQTELPDFLLRNTVKATKVRGAQMTIADQLCEFLLRDG